MLDKNKWSIRALGLSCCFLCLPVKAVTDFYMGGTGADLATMQKLGVEFSKRYPDVTVKTLPPLGSSGGIKALCASRLDIALTSRDLKPEEKKSNIQSKLYAYTPFIFVATPGYAKQTVSLTNLQKIYDASFSYWPDGRAARMVLRQPDDVDSTILKNSIDGFSRALQKAYQRKGKVVAFTDQESADYVERMSGAITTSSLSLIKAEKRNLMPLVFDGIEPSVENLKNGRYKLKKSLYFVFSTTPSEHVKNFMAFMKSDVVQKILLETGHLSIP